MRDMAHEEETRMWVSAGINVERAQVLALGLADPTNEERRAAWLADRKTCVTGTEISAILGLSGFMKPIDVYANKVGIRIVKENPAMHAGKRFERAILEEYAERHGVEIEFADPYKLIRVPGFDLLGATLDARRKDDGRPVDAKNIRFKEPYTVDDQGMATGFGEEGSDQVPTYYALQLHVQMMASDRPDEGYICPCADLAVCFTGQDFQTFTVQRDPAIDEMLKGGVSDWWAKHILGGVAPEPDGSESYTEYLKRKFARSGDVLLEPDEAMVDLVSALRIRKEELNAAGAAKYRIEQEIETIIGDAQGIKGLCSWKSIKDSVKVDWEAAFNEFWNDYAGQHGLDDGDKREIVSKFTTTKPGARVFRLSK